MPLKGYAVYGPMNSETCLDLIQFSVLRDQQAIQQGAGFDGYTAGRTRFSLGSWKVHID